MRNAQGKAAMSVLALTGIGFLVLASIAGAGHIRPKGASPLKVTLVPAYNTCTAPNRTHGPPLAFPSCNPAAPASSFLTVGTPDANGASAGSEGFMKFVAKFGSPGPPDDDNNIWVTFRITDVRCKAGTTSCGNANAADGPDYTGELQSDATIRLTDHFNGISGPGGADPATVIDFPNPMTATCSNTADTSIGASCTVNSTMQPLFPICNCETRRSVFEFGQIRVSDGGADGVVASEPQDNTVFMRQGIFIP